MKTNTTLTNILLLLVGTLLLYNILATNSINTNIKDYNQKITTIQIEVDSIQKANKFIDNGILDIKEQISILNKDISNVRSNITIIRKNTNEKANLIDKYNVHELSKYFSERYPSDTSGTSSPNGSQRPN
jgi:peptidoglycan hydrolase CwlO-like protein